MHPGGHDFLVIEGKFILDPWIKLFGLESELLFDVDSAKAVELYGCAENWVFMEGAENATLPDVSAIKAWQSKPFIFQQFVEMLKVWRTHQLRSFYNELS